MRENKNVKKLLKLAAENPSLPIEALVDSEVVANDDFNTWWGDVFDVSIEDLWGYPNEGGKTWTKDEALEDVFDFADTESEYLGDRYDDYEMVLDMDDRDAEKVIKEWIDEIPWKKCIVIFIGTPDNLTNRANGGDAG